MKTSSKTKVLELYEKSADSYAEMMNIEIKLPIYSDILSRLAKRIVDIPGLVIDTSCGSGHMLSMYHDLYDQNHALVGIDLSPRMVAISTKRLGSNAKVFVGDMCDLEFAVSDSSAAVLSFFAIHHLDPKNVLKALKEWNRILHPGGQLVIAAWEGSGLIDYGNESDVEALRYKSSEVEAWSEATGFVIDRCVVEPVEEIPMDAIYLEATKK